MWRSVIIYNGERLSVQDNWLVVSFEDETEKRIPLEDLYCVVIDNKNLVLSVPTLSTLAQHKIHLILTDERHLPVSQMYPINASYHCYRIQKKQLGMSDEFKGEIWKRITRKKIENQAVCLENSWAERDVVNRMRELASEVVAHDAGNREGISAKLFFRNVYGTEFIRFSDDETNSLLNYGYAIIRSGVAKSLVAHGFNCVMGVHHISETNEFNLADDFMEPLRPLVDEWIAKNPECIAEGLSKYVKNELVSLVNTEIIFDGKTMKVRYAIDSMVKSFITALETQNPDRLILPEMIFNHAK